MPLILYHTNPCSHTPAIRRVIKHLGVECEFRALEPQKLTEIEGAVYQESPILSDAGKIIEDWRLIVRHIDEQYGGKRLTGGMPVLQTELFELCDAIDRLILLRGTPLILPVVPSAMRSFLKPFLGSKTATVPINSASLRAEIISSVSQISADSRLKRPEFLLAVLFFGGAVEFLRTDPEFAARLPA